jgi:predicted nucleic acid-binding protein
LIVVSNSSPLIHLSRIGLLDLLPKLFGSVHVSRQVYEEVAVDGLGEPGSQEVAEARWIIREEVDPEGAIQFPSNLGIGEVTSILLAQRLKSDWLILDDSQARKTAKKTGLQVVGCVGILERAFRSRDLDDLRGAYASLLRSRAYVSLALVNAALQRSGLPPID